MQKKMVQLLAVSGLAVAAFAMGGCGESTPSTGSVVKGPVSGATVWADKVVSAGKGDGVQDASGVEKDASATTNADGSFYISPEFLTSAKFPNGYVFVSKGGTYKSVTGQSVAAPTFYAPAGAATISPITTLVALATDPAAVKAKIEALGVKFDADISKLDLGSANNKALLNLANTVSVTLNEAANNGATSPTAQQGLVAQFATQVAAATNLATTANSSTSLNTLVSTVLTNAASAGAITSNVATAVDASIDTKLNTIVSIVNSVTSGSTENTVINNATGATGGGSSGTGSNF